MAGDKAEEKIQQVAVLCGGQCYSLQEPKWMHVVMLVNIVSRYSIQLQYLRSFKFCG